MSICYSCESILPEDNRPNENVTCKQCMNSFCRYCSNRLCEDEAAACLRCQFSQKLLAMAFDPDHLDRFNKHDLRWVLSQHNINYSLSFDKNQLINILNSYLANGSNHGQLAAFEEPISSVFQVSGQRFRYDEFDDVELNDSDEELDEEDYNDNSEDHNQEEEDLGDVLVDEEEDLGDVLVDEEDGFVNELLEVIEDGDLDTMDNDDDDDYYIINEINASNQISSTINNCSTSLISATPSSNDDATQAGSDNDSRLCKICFNGPANCAFVGCGHVVACYKCSPRLKKCPICRKRIASFIKIYFS